jgi:hypothetical protein
LVVGSRITHAQFNYLANQGALAGTQVQSRGVLSIGMKKLEKEIPKLFYLAKGFPGCCFSPAEYVDKMLASIIGELGLSEGAPIILAWKEDGSPEGQFKKYPMLATCLNFPQRADCQSVQNCHVLAIARCSESAESERRHFGKFHELILKMADFEGHPLIQLQICDGSDVMKKCGLMGQQATYCCFRCMAKRGGGDNDITRLSWRADAVDDAAYLARVKQERRYARVDCDRTGKCICEHSDCAKFLAAEIDSKFPPESLLTNKENAKAHKARNAYANEKCRGQIRAPMGIVTHLDWIENLFYDLFHADKNHFTNCVWAPTVDVMAAIRTGAGATLSDDLSRELAATHNLGNLNVKQTEECKEELRKGGHIRDGHLDLIGAERRMLTEKKAACHVEGVDVSVTFAALMPLVRAAGNAAYEEAYRDAAKECFQVLHALWTAFDKASELRLSVREKTGDHSEVFFFFFVH